MRLILDCDPGNGVPGADVDDGLAIALALGAPGAELEAVTVAAGNAGLEAAYASAVTTLRRADRLDVPVHAGAGRPLVQDDRPLRRILDARAQDPQSAGLWRQAPDADADARPRDASAALALVERVRRRPGEVTVVALGPLTNVALACRLDPSFASDAARIVVMGGCVNVTGIRADLNFAYDPEAAQVVLRSGADLVLVPLDVTMATRWTLADNERLRRHPAPLQRWLGETSEPWIRWVTARRGLEGCWLHDPLAVAIALDGSLAELTPMHVDVELAPGSSRGATLAVPADHRGLPLVEPPSGAPNVRVATAIDAPRFERVFAEAVLGTGAGEAAGAALVEGLAP